MIFHVFEQLELFFSVHAFTLIFLERLYNLFGMVVNASIVAFFTKIQVLIIKKKRRYM